jgi:hypothetical protein
MWGFLLVVEPASTKGSKSPSAAVGLLKRFWSRCLKLRKKLSELAIGGGCPQASLMRDGDTAKNLCFLEVVDVFK